MGNNEIEGADIRNLRCSICHAILVEIERRVSQIIKDESGVIQMEHKIIMACPKRSTFLGLLFLRHDSRTFSDDGTELFSPRGSMWQPTNP
jgi:hypothetical protein